MRNMRNKNHKKRISLLLMFIVCGVLSQGYAAFAATRSLNVATPTQEEIRQYVEEHTGSSATDTIYSTEPVTEAPYSAGTLSDATLQSALNALNEIRYIAGIFDGVVLDSTYTAKCQAGTLVNCVNGVLSHTPSKPSNMDDDLYQLGYAGMSSSNIAWGYSSLVSAVQHGWMADEDSSNIDRLGHRRWCLNPEMGKTGFGQTGSYTAMYSFDSSHTVSQATTVVWPAQNMPTDYFDASYPWSISSDTAFSNDVKIVLTYVDGDSDASNDKKWEFSSAFADGYFNYDKQGYGQRYCLIFRPDDITMYYDNDKFEVQVIENNTVTLEYTVNFFDLKPIPEDVTLKLAKTYGSMELIDDGYYWSATTITVSDASIDIKKKMKIYSSDDSIAQAMIGTPSNGKATVFIKTNKEGVAQLTFQLTKNIKAVYKVTVGDGGGHVHNNIEVSIKEATCEQTGLRTLECEMCGVPSTEVIEVIDHDYDEGVVAKEPTCTAKGERILTCEACGGTMTEEIATVAHEYETTYTIDVKATCTINGSKSRHCKDCGDKTDISTIFTDGHVVGDWIIDKEATYTEAGNKHKECTVCHTVIESESIARLEKEPTVNPDAGQNGDQSGQQNNNQNGQQDDDQGAEQDVDSDVDEYIDPDSYEELEEDENWEDDEIMVSGGSNYYLVRYDDGEVTIAYAGPKDLSITELVVPSAIAMDGEVYRITAISDNAFAKCKKLKTVKMSKYITKIGKNAFSGCGKLTKVNLSSNLTAIGSGAFAKCTSLKSIVIPKSVKKIGSKAFYKCKKLKKITLKTTSLKSSTVGSKAFSGIEKKATVKVPKKKVVAYKSLLKKKGLPKNATVRRE